MVQELQITSAVALLRAPCVPAAVSSTLRSDAGLPPKLEMWGVACTVPPLLALPQKSICNSPPPRLSVKYFPADSPIYPPARMFLPPPPRVYNPPRPPPSTCTTHSATNPDKSLDGAANSFHEPTILESAPHPVYGVSWLPNRQAWSLQGGELAPFGQEPQHFAEEVRDQPLHGEGRHSPLHPCPCAIHPQPKLLHLLVLLLAPLPPSECKGGVRKSSRRQ